MVHLLKVTGQSMAQDGSSEACLICHKKIRGRPKEFPQIVSLKQHLLDSENEVEDFKNCLDCHDPIPDF